MRQPCEEASRNHLLREKQAGLTKTNQPFFDDFDYAAKLTETWAFSPAIIAAAAAASPMAIPT